MTDSGDIPQSNSLLYTVHLNNGEELLCTLLDETDHGIVIESPIVIKAVPMMDSNGYLRSELSTASWIPFASSRIFSIKHTDIMIYTEMHPLAHQLYTNLVNKLELFILAQPPVEPASDSFLVAPIDQVH